MEKVSKTKAEREKKTTTEEDSTTQIVRTTISAMTRGCLSGLRSKARRRVTKTTRHICSIASGSAKSNGLSPWNTPFEVAFIAAGHEVTAPVPFVAIPPSPRPARGPWPVARRSSSPRPTCRNPKFADRSHALTRASTAPNPDVRSQEFMEEGGRARQRTQSRRKSHVSAN